MYSIYHFFKSIVTNKEQFLKVKKLDEFQYNETMLSCKSIGVFPDMAIKLNKDKSIFSGGELIELKDSVTYSVSSFNSTIPSKTKQISKIISSTNSSIYKQMENAGNEVFSLPEREVYYLVRGRKSGQTKICLISGAFFETINIEKLINESFMQVLDESIKNSNAIITPEVKTFLHNLFSEQENFSKVRNVEKASVKLRFRIMTEVKSEGNILNSKMYPEIIDNSLNLIIQCDSNQQEINILKKFNLVFNKKELNQFKIFKLKHHLNGFFLVFQLPL
ncbi:MAG: hypothetical protein EPN82_05415 [Bacteroidetes bacterium]|nr:MAG: hypothetical protein EPN82_05415 [Bacteroidota bacterium]